MTFLTRQAFAKQFGESPDDLDMHVIYDVSHNIAKVRTVISPPPLPCCNNPSDLPLGPLVVVMHPTGGAAHGGRQAQDPARAPQGLHARLPAPPPSHPRRLPVHRYNHAAAVKSTHRQRLLLTGWLIMGVLVMPPWCGAGQPVLIGGTMGTCSYVLTGTEQVGTLITLVPCVRLRDS